MALVLVGMFKGKANGLHSSQVSQPECGMVSCFLDILGCDVVGGRCEEVDAADWVEAASQGVGIAYSSKNHQKQTL